MQKRSEEKEALIYSGNVLVDRDHKQWLMGCFRSPDDPLYDDAVEVKWATYSKGETRKQITEIEHCSTLSILLEGAIKITFYLPDGSKRETSLGKSGEFVLSRPGVRHTWEAYEDCVIIAVRWPSKRK